jgi:ribosomal protein L40E
MLPPRSQERPTHAASIPVQEKLCLKVQGNTVASTPGRGTLSSRRAVCVGVEGAADVRIRPELCRTQPKGAGMHCRQCGAPNEESYGFCFKCGTDLAPYKAALGGVVASPTVPVDVGPEARPEVDQETTLETQPETPSVTTFGKPPEVPAKTLQPSAGPDATQLPDEAAAVVGVADAAGGHGETEATGTIPAQICGNCGAPSPSQAKICENCGAPAVQVPLSEESPQQTKSVAVSADMVSLASEEQDRGEASPAIPAKKPGWRRRRDIPREAGMLDGGRQEEAPAALNLSSSGPSRRKSGRTRVKVGLIIAGAVAVLAVGLAVFLLLFLRPEFVVTDLRVSDGVVSGEDFLVTVDVANEGRTAGEYELGVLVDGEVVRARPIALDAGTRGQISVGWSGRPVGSYVVTLDDWPEFVQTVSVTPKFVVKGLEVPAAVVSGQGILATVDLANEGRTAGEFQLGVLVDGQVAQAEQISLDGGTREQVPVKLTGLSPGRYDISLDGFTGFTRTVWVMTPADFRTESINVQPNPIDITATSEATVVVRVANVGEAMGSHKLELTLNGQVVDTREIELKGESYADETFTVTVPEAGSYEIAVGGELASLEVFQIERLENGTILVNELEGGSNRLKITNNYDTDCVVIYTAQGEDQPVLLAVYVRGHSSYTVRRIKSGTYSIYYALGEEWCVHRKQFTKNPSYGLFEEPAELSSGSSFYTTGTLIFGSTEGASSEVPVAPGSFPTISGAQ